MKKLFSCLIAILILAACAFTCFAEAPSVSVSASNTNASVGDTFTVSVNLSAESNLTMLKFTVNFSTTHFEYVSGSLSSGKMFDIEELGSSGTISFFGTSYEPVVNGGTVISMKFKVLQGGGTISVASVSSDSAESVTAGSITFKDCAHGNMTWETVKTSTCKEQGTKKGTCPCGFTKDEPLPLGEHKFGTPVVKKQPTCTEAGTQVPKCTLCNADGTPETIPAKGHSYGNWIVTRVPTQFMSGEQRRVCSNCLNIETQTIDRLPTIPKEPEYNYTFCIQSPSMTEIRNKDGIILHANVEGNAPNGSYVKWESSNGNFDEDADGNKLEIIARNKGYTTFTAILCDADGNELARDSVEMYSKSGFFDKIGGFFRSLFGSTKIYEN